jgi:murein DD-endopeptidase MepM/ murein hydrolase activator NlpD
VYTWPVKGEIISGYSLEVLAYDPTMGDWRTHSGVDIAAELGTPVLAFSAGTVESVAQDDLMGMKVTISHANGVKSIYANLAAKPSVKAGDKVETGTVIGAVGNTAIAESSRPSHLHFEVSKDGVPVDPQDYLA